MIEPMILCDGCKKVKGEANHWFAGRSTTNTRFYSLARFDQLSKDILGTCEHYCGMDCLLKRVNQHLDPAKEHSSEEE